MELQAFLARICDDGIEAARHDYQRPTDRMKLEGAIAGFTTGRACTSPEALYAAYKESNHSTQRFFQGGDDAYWYWRCKTAELEWCCNVVSAWLHHQRRPSLGRFWPTARAYLKMSQVLELRYPPKAAG